MSANDPTRLPRRAFLKTVASGAVVGASGCKLGQKEPSVFHFAPAVTEVGRDSALLWVRTKGPAQVLARYGASADLEGAAAVPAVDVTAATDFTAALPLDLSQLPAGGRCHAEAFVRTGANGDVERRSQRVEFPYGPDDSGDVTFAWSADLRHSFAPFTILDVIGGLNPHFMVIAGDLAYTDLPRKKPALTIAEYRQKHAEIRADPHLQRLLQKVPVYAVWDDHDVADNFNRHHKRLEIGYQAFMEYWPLRAPNPPGMYRSVRWGPDVEVFILDCRRFRDNPKQKGRGPKTMLGADQLRWVKEAMAQSDATFKSLVTSVPLLSPFGHDCWFSFPRERDILKAFLRDSVSGTVIVLSADFHIAYALEDKPHRLHEFIVGPLASHKVPIYMQSAEKSGVGTYLFGDRKNFGMVRVGRSDGQLAAEVSVIDETGAVRHQIRIPAA